MWNSLIVPEAFMQMGLKKWNHNKPFENYLFVARRTGLRSDTLRVSTASVRAGKTNTSRAIFNHTPALCVMCDVHKKVRKMTQRLSFRKRVQIQVRRSSYAPNPACDSWVSGCEMWRLNEQSSIKYQPCLLFMAQTAGLRDFVTGRCVREEEKLYPCWKPKQRKEKRKSDTAGHNTILIIHNNYSQHLKRSDTLTRGAQLEPSLK